MGREVEPAVHEVGTARVREPPARRESIHVRGADRARRASLGRLIRRRARSVGPRGGDGLREIADVFRMCNVCSYMTEGTWFRKNK